MGEWRYGSGRREGSFARPGVRRDAGQPAEDRNRRRDRGDSTRAARQEHLGTVTLGDRGQIVIPKAARDQFGLKGGTRMIIVSDEQGIAMIPAETFAAKMQELMAMLSD